MTAPPLAIDRVERSRAKRDQVRLRLSGRWLSAGDTPEIDALLVVQLHGRRHRFPATGDAAETTTEQGGGSVGTGFTATFTIPDWAVPEQPGQAVLWVGDAVVPVPPPGMKPAKVATDAAPAAAAESSAAESSVAEISARRAAGDDPLPARVSGDELGPGAIEYEAAGAGRSGPLADLLFKETVSALHSELEQRTVEVARLRSTLARVRTDLDSRSGAQSGLESAHAELREEMRRLIAAVAEQRGEFDDALATLTGERDQAREELQAAQRERDAARDELDAARTEASAARDEASAARDEAGTARGEAGTARGERDAMRGELETARTELRDARTERDEAVRERDEQVAALRAEADRRVAGATASAQTAASVARQETEAMLSAARGQADARAGEAEAHARELSERLQEQAALDRRRGEESSRLREQLAAAHVARDAALGEAGGLRSELERLSSELGAIREHGDTAGQELTDARQLLADARALTERLRST